MNPLIDPSDEPSLVETLRKSDLPVALKPVELANRLAARRKHNRKRRAMVAIGIPVGIAVIGWFGMGKLNQTPSPENPTIVQLEPVIGPAQQGQVNADSVDVSTYQLIAARLEQREMLAAKKGKLRQLQHTTKLLRDLKSRQQWTLTRELVSRTEIDRSISAVQF